MRVENQIKDLQAELKEMLGASKRMEEALERSRSKDLQERLRGLLALDAMQNVLDQVTEHCQLQKHPSGSSFREDLSGAESLCMSCEHAEIERVLHRFREELKSATADAATAIVPLGVELIRQIRAHVRDEREVLKHIETPGPITEEILLRYTESPD